jgi:hypothetical protein
MEQNVRGVPDGPLHLGTVPRTVTTMGGPPSETALNFRVAAPSRFFEGAEGLLLSLE